MRGDTFRELRLSDCFVQRLLNVGAEDLRRVTRLYLGIPDPIRSTVAGPELVEAAMKEQPGLFKEVRPL